MIDVKAELRASFKRRGLTPPKKPYKPEPRLLDQGDLRECVVCEREIPSTSQGEVICTPCRSIRAAERQARKAERAA